jgi:glycogen synthase
MVSTYWQEHLQVIVIANGPYQEPFRHVVGFHEIHNRVAVCDFDEELSHLGYAASDFILMPSSFEPCGLPQMIGLLYGSLPIVHDTGGLHDTIEDIDVEARTGNGFVFKVFDSNGLRWCVDQAMAFHRLPPDIRRDETSRVMREAAQRFNHEVTARKYFDLYEKMLKRPLVKPF